MTSVGAALSIEVEEASCMPGGLIMLQCGKSGGLIWPIDRRIGGLPKK
jgi:hypothetical protein